MMRALCAPTICTTRVVLPTAPLLPLQAPTLLPSRLFALLRALAHPEWNLTPPVLPAKATAEVGARLAPDVYDLSWPL